MCWYAQVLRSRDTSLFTGFVKQLRWQELSSGGAQLCYNVRLRTELVSGSRTQGVTSSTLSLFFKSVGSRSVIWAPCLSETMSEPITFTSKHICRLREFPKSHSSLTIAKNAITSIFRKSSETSHFTFPDFRLFSSVTLSNSTKTDRL